MTSQKDTLSKRTPIFRYIILSAMTTILLAMLVVTCWMILSLIRYQYVSVGFEGKDINRHGLFPAGDIFVIKQRGGVVISEMKFRYAAAKAGLNVGDSIIAVNGVSLNETPQAFYRALMGVDNGDSIIYDFIRDDKHERCVLFLEPNPAYSSPSGYLGISTENLTPKLIDSFHIKSSTGVLINDIRPNSPANAAGLRVGDLIVSVDTIQIRNKITMDSLLEFTVPRQQVYVGYARHQDTHKTAFITLAEPPPSHIYFFGGTIEGSPAYMMTSFYLPMVSMPLILLIVGAFIGWLRTRDTIAYRCSIWFLCMGIYSLQVVYFIFTVPLMGAWPLWGLAVNHCIVSVSCVVLVLLSLRLFSIFPNTSRLGKIFLKWQWIAFLFVALITIMKIILAFTNWYEWRIPALISNIFTAYETKYTILEDFSIAGIIISLLLVQRFETRRKLQTRLKIIEITLLISIVVMIIYLLKTQVFPELGGSVWAWIVLLTPPLVILLISSAFVYTILFRKLFDIRFIIRKGLRYLLLSKGALLVEGIIVFLIVIQILSYAGTEFLNSPTAVGGVAVASTLAVIAVVGRVNRKLMPVIDRRFFREVLDIRKLLLNLNQQLSAIREREIILQQTANTVLRALHPARVVMLLKHGKSDEFRCELILENERVKLTQPEQSSPTRHAELGSGSKPGSVQIPNQVRNDGLVSWMLKTDDTIIKQMEEKRGWVMVNKETLDLENDEDKRLSAVNCELLIGLRGSSGLIGVMGLGDKLSEEPYSKEDRELLLTVAHEMGMALENAELLEVAKREAEFSKELDIARQVQQNLFPKQLPTPTGWEFAGICKPAKAVGGDYYDIFEAVPGKVVVALGDVSGKGLGASFVMSGVHSTIRTQAKKSFDNPVEMIDELNEYLLGSTSKNIFVTLFLGIIDLETGRMQYVNCGHPPAFVVRKENGEIEKLTRTGLALGMMNTIQFTQGSSTLKAGDSLIVYIDGITEAMNEKEEFFDEERLVKIVNIVSKLEAASMMEEIMKSVDKFAGTHEQADDISVIIVQRQKSISS